MESLEKNENAQLRVRSRAKSKPASQLQLVTGNRVALGSSYGRKMVREVEKENKMKMQEQLRTQQQNMNRLYSSALNPSNNDSNNKRDIHSQNSIYLPRIASTNTVYISNNKTNKSNKTLSQQDNRKNLNLYDNNTKRDMSQTSNNINNNKINDFSFNNSEGDEIQKIEVNTKNNSNNEVNELNKETIDKFGKYEVQNETIKQLDDSFLSQTDLKNVDIDNKKRSNSRNLNTKSELDKTKQNRSNSRNSNNYPKSRQNNTPIKLKPLQNSMQMASEKKIIQSYAVPMLGVKVSDKYNVKKNNYFYAMQNQQANTTSNNTKYGRIGKNEINKKSSGNYYNDTLNDNENYFKTSLKNDNSSYGIVQHSNQNYLYGTNANNIESLDRKRNELLLQEQKRHMEMINRINKLDLGISLNDVLDDKNLNREFDPIDEIRETNNSPITIQVDQLVTQCDLSDLMGKNMTPSSAPNEFIVQNGKALLTYESKEIETKEIINKRLATRKILSQLMIDPTRNDQLIKEETKSIIQKLTRANIDQENKQKEIRPINKDQTIKKNMNFNNNNRYGNDLYNNKKQQENLNITNVEVLTIENPQRSLLKNDLLDDFNSVSIIEPSAPYKDEINDFNLKKDKKTDEDIIFFNQSSTNEKEKKNPNKNTKCESSQLIDDDQPRIESIINVDNKQKNMDIISEKENNQESKSLDEKETNTSKVEQKNDFDTDQETQETNISGISYSIKEKITSNTDEEKENSIKAEIVIETENIKEEKNKENKIININSPQETNNEIKRIEKTIANTIDDSSEENTEKEQDKSQVQSNTEEEKNSQAEKSTRNEKINEQDKNTSYNNDIIQDFISNSNDILKEELKRTSDKNEILLEKIKQNNYVDVSSELKKQENSKTNEDYSEIHNEKSEKNKNSNTELNSKEISLVNETFDINNASDKENESISEKSENNSKKKENDKENSVNILNISKLDNNEKESINEEIKENSQYSSFVKNENDNENEDENIKSVAHPNIEPNTNQESQLENNSNCNEESYIGSSVIRIVPLKEMTKKEVSLIGSKNINEEVECKITTEEKSISDNENFHQEKIPKGLEEFKIEIDDKTLSTNPFNKSSSIEASEFIVEVTKSIENYSISKEDTKIKSLSNQENDIEKSDQNSKEIENSNIGIYQNNQTNDKNNTNLEKNINSKNEVKPDEKVENFITNTLKSDDNEKKLTINLKIDVSEKNSTTISVLVSPKDNMSYSYVSLTPPSAIVQNSFNTTKISNDSLTTSKKIIHDEDLDLSLAQSVVHEDDKNILQKEITESDSLSYNVGDGFNNVEFFSKNEKTREKIDKYEKDFNPKLNSCIHQNITEDIEKQTLKNSTQEETENLIKLSPKIENKPLTLSELTNSSLNNEPIL